MKKVLILCFVLGLSFIGCNILTDIETAINEYDDELRAAEKKEAFAELKEQIPLIKQWIEAKEKYCKSHKEDCKVLKDNGGFAHSDSKFFQLDGRDFGVHWPSEWMDRPTGLLSSREKPKHCTNDLYCISEHIACFAYNATVYCRAGDFMIMGALKDYSNYPLGNRLSCLATRDDKMANEFCKEISSEGPLSFDYNPDFEDRESRFSEYCKDPENRVHCKKIARDNLAENPMDEFNFYPL